MNRRETQINRRGPGLKMTSCSRGPLSSELCRLFQSQCIQKKWKEKKKSGFLGNPFFSIYGKLHDSFYSLCLTHTFHVFFGLLFIFLFFFSYKLFIIRWRLPSGTGARTFLGKNIRSRAGAAPLHTMSVVFPEIRDRRRAETFGLSQMVRSYLLSV